MIIKNNPFVPILLPILLAENDHIIETLNNNMMLNKTSAFLGNKDLRHDFDV